MSKSEIIESTKSLDTYSDKIERRECFRIMFEKNNYLNNCFMQCNKNFEVKCVFIRFKLINFDFIEY